MLYCKSTVDARPDVRRLAFSAVRASGSRKTLKMQSPESHKRLCENIPLPEVADFQVFGRGHACGVPTITRLLALSHHFKRLVREDAVKDYAEIARITGLTRARVTQIVNLTLLAADIQEEILFAAEANLRLPLGQEPRLRRITGEPAWEMQRRPLQFDQPLGAGETTALPQHNDPSDAPLRLQIEPAEGSIPRSSIREVGEQIHSHRLVARVVKTHPVSGKGHGEPQRGRGKRT